MTDFEDCLKRRGLIRFTAAGPDVVVNELRAATEDMADSIAMLEQARWKRATITAYYVMFHSARALVLGRGYAEKSHTVSWSGSGSSTDRPLRERASHSRSSVRASSGRRPTMSRTSRRIPLAAHRVWPRNSWTSRRASSASEPPISLAQRPVDHSARPLDEPARLIEHHPCLNLSERALLIGDGVLHP